MVLNVTTLGCSETMDVKWLLKNVWGKMFLFLLLLLF